jgi:hypothetical protein
LQGGGHSALSSKHGMAADQVLEWEVMTANGKHLVATPTKHADLYWALSGGGGGTYGVVLSVTVKAFKDGVVGGASLSFNTSSISEDTFWQAITTFHASLPAIVDSGAGVLYSLENTSFIIIPITSPGSSKDDMTTLLQPFITALHQLAVPFSLTITSFPQPARKPYCVYTRRKSHLSKCGRKLDIEHGFYRSYETERTPWRRVHDWWYSAQGHTQSSRQQRIL